jgi:hypothetical protein
MGFVWVFTPCRGWMLWHFGITYFFPLQGNWIGLAGCWYWYDAEENFSVGYKNDVEVSGPMTATDGGRGEMIVPSKGKVRFLELPLYLVSSIWIQWALFCHSDGLTWIQNVWEHGLTTSVSSLNIMTLQGALSWYCSPLADCMST